MHEHIVCEHEIKYCKVCEVCYCEKCKTEWKKGSAITYTYPNTWVGTNIPYTISNTDFNRIMY